MQGDAVELYQPFTSVAVIQNHDTRWTPEGIAARVHELFDESGINPEVENMMAKLRFTMTERADPVAANRPAEGVARVSITAPDFSIALDGFGTGDVRCLRRAVGHAGRTAARVDVRHPVVAPTCSASPAAAGGVDDAFPRQHDPGIGAEIMGAEKFGPPGWHHDPEWLGWSSPYPPFHTPTFVLTHRPRLPIEMPGGTTFHFIDASPAAALETARGLQAASTSASAAAPP